jgi:alpha-beta hydrolase superfamily lysophospholipase
MIKKLLKLFLFLFLIFIVVSNVVLYNHAYNFTHFSDKELPKITTQSLQEKTLREQAELAFFGVEIPKSKNTYKPKYRYETLTIGTSPQLHCWLMKTSRSRKRGVVLLFHGYTSKKSNLLNAAYIFRSLGYHCLLVDFRGHGDSEGLETTIGYKEAKDVQRCYQSMQRRYPKLPIILMGTSMGSVSILKAIHDYQLEPQKIVIECPFKDMRTAVVQRFKRFKLPHIVMPDMLLFWGDWQTGIKSRKHNSVRYAEQVTTPTLVIYGAKDQRVDRHEIDAVYAALAGPKKLVVFEDAGHDHIIDDVGRKWTTAVWDFLKTKH